MTNDQTNSNNQNSNDRNSIDLENRTFEFAKACRNYVKHLPKTLSNLEYAKQLIRSSGSVASNYIEANESLSKKDFKNRLKICRKEAKETRLWLRLTKPHSEQIPQQEKLIKEATELVKIFNSIIKKV